MMLVYPMIDLIRVPHDLVYFGHVKYAVTILGVPDYAKRTVLVLPVL